MTLPFSKFPGYNPIFIDYIYNFDKLKEYFECDFRNKEDIFKAIYDREENYLKNKEFTRDVIADILKTQNQFFNSPEKTFQNIDLLRQENTFAVVTGQQVGLLSGNYYTILKALNTLQLCEKYKKQFPDYNFVPVFWLESDDHDFLEINNINIFDKENHLLNLKYFENGIEREKYLTPANKIILDETFENFKNELKQNLINTEFSEKLFEYIDESYKTGVSLTVAFARFMNYLLGNTGIIFCNPSDKEIKKLLIPVFEKELNTYPRACEYVIETSAIIEQNYEPQVKPKPINVFYVFNGSRYLLEPRNDNIFALKNSRQKFTAVELFEDLYANPENFSGNVILRPICQDYVLPTIAYVGGPSEISYFAQLKSVYNFYKIKMPVIYPRTSITVLENRISGFLSKFNLSIEELLDEQKVTAKLMNKINSVKADEIFANYYEEFKGMTYSFSKELEKIDKNLSTVFENRNVKYVEQLDILKEKLIESQSKQNESSVKKLKSVAENIFPNESFQERQLNIVYYINKYGFNLIQDLISKIIIDEFNHQLIEINFQEVTAGDKNNASDKNVN